MNRAGRLTDRRRLLQAGLFGLLCGGRPAFALPLAAGAPGRESATADVAPDGAVPGINAFSIDLHARLASDAGNLIYSPTGVAIALAMATVGAEGETREQMLGTLHAGPDPERWIDAVGALSRSLDAAAAPDALADLQVANRLWGQRGVRFGEPFLRRLADDFAAPFGEADFRGGPEPSREAINRWVAERTADRILDLLPQGSITPLTRLVLTDAVRFDADWRFPFSAERTRELPFAIDRERKVTVPMMRQKGQFAYAENDLLQAVELPYAGDDFSLVALLPRRAGGLVDVERMLTAERLASWLDGLDERQVDLFLPKFRIESRFDLIPRLEQLGMQRAFSVEAEFGPITTDDRLSITGVLHQAMIEVDERGTEAAAATGVVIGIRSAAPTDSDEATTFRADHPFLILLRHRPSGAILFGGRVSDPSRA
jgi:serpin B